MWIYILLAQMMLAGAFWIWVEMRDTREYNKKLFLRAWQLQLFLMDIYPDCPPDVQDKIEQYLNNITEL